MEESWIHLVRHGETTGGSSVRFYGRTDIPLSDLGCGQIRRLKPALDPRPIRRVLTSEMLRARQSAEILLEGRALAPTVYPPFNEVDFGRLEGMTEDEVRKSMPEYWKLWRIEKKAIGYPGGDRFEGFRRRVVEGALAIERDGGWPNETLVVAHRGVIRHLLGHFLRLDVHESRRLAPELGERISLRWDGSLWLLDGRSLG